MIFNKHVADSLEGCKRTNKTQTFVEPIKNSSGNPGITDHGSWIMVALATESVSALFYMIINELKL